MPIRSTRRFWMNSRMRFLAILFAVSANNLASAESCNDKICNKEYSISEPIQRAVCKAFGASNPGVRDCLRAQRARTGGAKRDTFSKIVFRHVKCFTRASAIRRRGATKCRPTRTAPQIQQAQLLQHADRFVTAETRTGIGH